jgi:threonylcarbamoyladenosine tRNA methylthiotransferase CDKAL1
MKAHVESYGCAANRAYGTSIEDTLYAGGFQLSESSEAADLVIVNTCTVKGQTEARMVERIREISRAGKRVVVTGCMATAQRGLVASLVNPENVVSLEEFRSSFGGHTMNTHEDLSTSLPPLPSKPVGRRAIMPVARGCLGSCSYCIVRLAVGPLRGYRIAALTSHVRKMADTGASEIYLTSQDLAAFGHDNGETLPALLEDISRLPGNFRVRLGMMTPNRAAPFFDDLLAVLDGDRRFYRFLHLPLQSGDDTVLRLMGREYRSSDFMSLVDKARRRMPTLNVTTDIIVGFPFENTEAFQNTMLLIEEALPNKVNISRFTPRPHTVASLLPQTDRRIVDERSREACGKCKEITGLANQRLVGERIEVIPHRGSEGSYLGRAANFLPVRIKADRSLEVHSPVLARIVAATPSRLVASA